ncbi:MULTISPECIES: peptide chain release factor N(5)-glutamine methyltransferase [Aneurinibacillus]|uniref:Release factor glutamine methyltransferase n=1 Tax=Aneurinibacillus thermoaerophilus TaxID=143495 RepID=A0A1G8DTV9_ANETH|nr:MULTISPECIES: peptide chain release factor N(5)-glutamine methyltransferase [Aneurinibacillus]AMA71620.1 protein-(glutamine-N5) methyltransferase, release factor-specific [Aneurinibacillus sp. XH2]MED0676814.1 peptide chain release factor N(5)-glutamine methyltransferase [Aneurinibacillus thermoaerophilus]MED0735698.1 peptide chain release factor N(5)-glutamine methyltransferase [Aneurinibacillus thermoaerophilus]MED0757601.1 peptide chain release factor N(5)-glutamine methyltransferase [Ane
MKGITVREALQKASRFLREKGIEDAAFLAEYAIRHALGWDRTRFISGMSYTLTEEEWAAIEAILLRRTAGEPMQYIVGEQEFYGLAFEVNPSVLIPRPETELLVEEIVKQAFKLWPADAALFAADIGTGSGVIAVTLAVIGGANWRITATDIAEESLATASRNAKRHHVENKVSFAQGDLLAPLLNAGQRVDILVSNPPYIPSADIIDLDVQVKDHEPRRALDGGEDGLDFYRRIIEGLDSVLTRRALVGFEVGIHQADTVRCWLMETGLFLETYIVRDLAGIGRHVIAIR